eukprot:TRINITY_DN18173_c0_g1_i1.p1 TRINITY_DN18173_c0_g1~~TRINITY_DN18173_c0_g1_i1.p1  ORF type:complete len:1188 (-),score=174.80 TRINITY_DN18173_c0_g1_i1:40-3177(-)
MSFAVDIRTTMSCVSKKHRRTMASILSESSLSGRCSGLFSSLSECWRIVTQPHSKIRIAWAIFGAVIVLYDVIYLPLHLGWDLNADSGFHLLMRLLAIPYWFVDMMLSFVTAIFSRGVLVYDKVVIAKKYTKSWFLFDITLLSIDCVMLSSGSTAADSAGTTRVARLFRLIGIVRLLRMVRLNKMLYFAEDFTGMSLEQEARLAVQLIKVLLIVVLAVHILACGWFLVGRASGEVMKSWTHGSDSTGGDRVEEWSMDEQYLLCIHWALGQFTPAPMNLYPANSYERAYNVCVIFFSLCVMGSCISNISASLNLFVKIRSDRESTMRKLQQYARRNRIDAELTMRILKFADYVLKRRVAVHLDSSLLSDNLLLEMHVSQRGPFLVKHPVFKLLQDVSQDSFSQLCKSLKETTHEEGAFIFREGSAATGMHITRAGAYILQSKLNNETEVVTGQHLFAELGLFCNYRYQASLQASTHGDILTLTASELVACVKQSPSACSLMHQYAVVRLGYVRNALNMYDGLATKAALAATKDTYVYQLINLQEQDRVNMFWIDNLPEPSSETLQALYGKARPGCLEAAELVGLLTQSFPELAIGLGTYDHFSQTDQRNRTLSSLVSALWLLQDRYEDFVAPQANATKPLSREVWDLLQEFVAWTGIKDDPELLHVSMVLLTIKHLGKVQKIVRQLDRDWQQPEKAVLFMAERMKNLVPSVSALSPAMMQLLLHVQSVHERFVLGQFAQAESTSYNVLQLKVLLDEYKDEPVLKVYLFTAACMMCGIGSARGGLDCHGSAFLDEDNGRTLAQCISALRDVQHEHSSIVYWRYLISRACSLGLPSSSASDLAMLRLACLCRVTDTLGFQSIRKAWITLHSSEQQLLIGHFLKDGIHDGAILFSFLPLCLANALSNPVVGLHAFLVLLIELVDMVSFEKHSQTGQDVVDMSDLAGFTLAVKSRSLFSRCLSNATLTRMTGRIYLNMTSKNWLHVDQIEESEDVGVSKMLRLIIRKQRAVEDTSQQILEALGGKFEPASSSHWGRSVQADTENLVAANF